MLVALMIQQTTNRLNKPCGNIFGHEKFLVLRCTRNTPRHAKISDFQLTILIYQQIAGL